MTTIKATMNLMALLKVGAVVEFRDRNLRVQIEDGLISGRRITVRRQISATAWVYCNEWEISPSGLQAVCDYLNLPF
jgi:hypothetical protein